MSALSRASTVTPLNKASTVCETEIEGISTKGFVDTGAGISMISEKFRQSSKLLSKLKLNRANIKATSVNNEPVELLGLVELHIKLGSLERKWGFYVTREMSHPVLLGWDFIQANNITINGAKSEMLVGSSRVEFLPLWKVLPRVSTASLKESIVVPPRCEMTILAKLDPVRNYEVVPDGFDGVLESKDVFRSEDGIIIARTAGSVKQGMTPVRLMNVSESEVTMQANTILGSFYAATPKNMKVARVGFYEFVEDKVTDCVKVNMTREDGPVQGKKAPSPPVNLDDSILNVDQRRRAESLLVKFRVVFSDSKSTIGRTSLAQHRIDTGDAHPIKQPPRRIPFAMREELDNQVQDMLKQDVIEPSRSPWSSPVVLVRKKDGSTRFCVDYRRLNAVTCKDAHPLPRVDDCLDALSDSRVFSTLDCASGYWQVEVKAEDREKTAFSTGENLYHFKVMPFGLTNAPATFQRLMDLVLAGMHWKCCLVYLDDIIVYTKGVEEHLSQLEQVFSCLRAAGLTLKTTKCQLFRDSVTFLGHKVSSQGIGPDPANIEKVKSFPAPRNTSEVQSFLGLASYYRKFVKNFADVAEPLHRLLHKDVKFEWNDACQSAFESLRSSLTRNPVLAYPDFSETFQLQTDASKWAVGAVLSQRRGD